MAIFKRGRIYWYKFMWNGEMIRESTKQGSDKKTRNIESAHRTRRSKQEDARQDARLRLKCSEVLLCDECEKWFNAEGTRRQEGHGFVAHTRLKHKRGQPDGWERRWRGALASRVLCSSKPSACRFSLTKE